MVVSLDNNRENYVYFAVSKILVLKVDDGFSLFMMLIFFVKTALKTALKNALVCKRTTFFICVV